MPRQPVIEAGAAKMIQKKKQEESELEKIKKQMAQLMAANAKLVQENTDLKQMLNYAL